MRALPFFTRVGVCLGAVCCLAVTSHARQWTDAAGNVVMEAELFGMNDEFVVVRRSDGELGVLNIEELAQSDRDYLQSEDARLIDEENVGSTQTWTTRSGIELRGRVVDYATREMTVQRRRGRIYVNDRRLTNLPESYQRLVKKIIEHFDQVDLPNQRALERWVREQRGRPRTFRLDGVILQGESGDEYPIPFFAFSEADQELLKSGWPAWLEKQEDYDQRDDLAFRLEALAAAYLENQELKRDIALVNLKLQAVASGVTSLWEVTLYPQPGHRHPPMWVVVPGRNSEQAINAALEQHPGFTIGPVRRVSR